MIALARRRTDSRATPTAPRLSHPHPTAAPEATGGASVVISRFAPGETRSVVAHRTPCESWKEAEAIFHAIARTLNRVTPEPSPAIEAHRSADFRGLARVIVKADRTEGPQAHFEMCVAVEDADEAPQIYAAALATMTGGAA